MASTTVAQLKEKGNQLYAARDYRAAHEKYSQAIEADPTNAILFSNRAACSLGMQKYEDAVADGRKATILDPSFTRAWIRLGEGLKNTCDYYDSIAAYVTALYTLPTTNLPQSSLDFQKRCKDELRVLSVKATRKTIWFLDDALSQGETPWLRAYNMNDRLMSNTEEVANSSAKLILDALLSWYKGLELVGKYQPQRARRYGSQRIDEKALTKNQAFDALTDGILRDPRIFYVDVVDFANKLSDKAEYDSMQWNARHLFRSDDMEYVIREIHDILQGGERNWDLARPWLSIVVRHKVFRAFGDDDTAGTPEVSLHDYAKVFRVIDWVRTTYPDVPDKTRGIIFSDDYVNAIKCLYMDSLIRICITNLGPGNTCPPETFHKVAQEMLESIEGNHRPKLTQLGDQLAFRVYPKARALAAIGLYHRLLAMTQAVEGPGVVREHYRKAAEHYEFAGMEFPADDEYHAWYLNAALDMKLRCQPAVGDVLTIAEEIRETVPRMKKVWEYSALWQAGRDAKLERTARLEARLREKVAGGELTGESEVPAELLWMV